MKFTLNRRQMLGAAALVTPTVAIPQSALVQTPIPSGSSQSAKIGDPRENFNATFGEGQDDDGVAVYDFSADEKAIYRVGFDNDGQAESVEGDFSAMPNGGLELTPESVGQSQFVPNDGEMQFVTEIGQYRPTARFYVAQFYSPALADESGRSGNVIVADEISDTDTTGPGPYELMVRTNVAMETFEVNPITPTGNAPGVLSSRDEWEAAYGESYATTTLQSPESPPVPGSWLFGEQIDVEPETPFSPEDAAIWIGDMLPVESELLTTYWLPPSPNGPIGLRYHLWSQPEAGYIVSLQFVDSDEESGEVNRLVIAPVVEPAWPE